MSSLISIYIGGILTLVITFHHTQLYKKLNWSKDFDKIEKSNAKALLPIAIAGCYKKNIYRQTQGIILISQHRLKTVEKDGTCILNP